MRFARVVSTAGVVLIATMIPAFAQQVAQSERKAYQGQRQRQSDRQEDQRIQQERQQERQQDRQQDRQARSDQRQQDRREQAQRQPQRSRQQAQAWQRQRGWQQGGGWQGRRTWQQSRAQRWSNDHRSWAQRGGYGGYYIPSNSFSLYFGSNNFFRMRSRPVMYQGYPRFQHNGFSFLMVDPYPESWAENWYDTDDVYVDYDDGYYLHNRRDPGVRLAISIVL